MTKISGKKLFGRFGWTCAQERLEKGLIKPCDFEELKSCIEESCDPDVVLLTLCFPTPVRELRKFARELRRNMWAYDVVLAFLQQHKGLSEHCTVKFATLVEDPGGDTVTVLCGSQTEVAFNTFGLELDPVLLVMIHRNQILTQLESATAR